MPSTAVHLAEQLRRRRLVDRYKAADLIKTLDEGLRERGVVELVWTRELPKAEGYFWWREAKGSEEVILEVICDRGTLRAVGRGLHTPEYLGGEWAGPLATPRST